MVELEDRLRLITTIYSLLPDTERGGVNSASACPRKYSVFSTTVSYWERKEFSRQPEDRVVVCLVADSLCFCYQSFCGQDHGYIIQKFV